MGDGQKITGGCYCGAVRYESTEAPLGSGMCHCRMCQKWSGGAAAMAVFFDEGSFRFTRGEPRAFKSSAIFERSFCVDCGTSLMARYVVGEHTATRAVYIGTLDHPEVFDGPGHHFGIESHLPNWVILESGIPQMRADDSPWLVEAWASVSGDDNID